MAGTDLVKVIPVPADGEGKSLERYTSVNELVSDGGFTQAAFVADSAVPYADLTAAANHVNSILAALRDAGIMASS